MERGCVFRSRTGRVLSLRGGDLSQVQGQLDFLLGNPQAPRNFAYGAARHRHLEDRILPLFAGGGWRSGVLRAGFFQQGLEGLDPPVQRFDERIHHLSFFRQVVGQINRKRFGFLQQLVDLFQVGFKAFSAAGESFRPLRENALQLSSENENDHHGGGKIASLVQKKRPAFGKVHSGI